jgi:hypothetical protein
MKLVIRAHLEDESENPAGLEFDIDVPPAYAVVAEKGVNILSVVTEAVERIKEELHAERK